VGILGYARQTTLIAVEGMSIADLEHLLAGLAARDDEWLEQPLRAAPAMNAHWAWFHVAEDEINHRGQIRWLRARLPSASR
jgi:hypothetical protein